MRRIRAPFVRDVISGVEFFDTKKLNCGAVEKAAKSRRGDDAGICRRTDKCKCGERGVCLFTKELNKSSTMLQLSGVLTKAFMKFLMSRKGLLYTVFEAFYGTCERVLHAYAAVKGLTYGKDVMLVLKGGNVFRMTFESTLTALGIKPDAQWAEQLGVGDLDFEVHLTNATALNMREVMRVMAVAMISIREWLLENLPDWPLQASDVDFGDIVSKSGTQVQTDVSQSDSVVGPVDDEPTCPGCDTIYMAVPSVIKSLQKKSGQGTWLFGRSYRGKQCRFPMTFNLTLARNAAGQTDAEVLRIRRSVQVGTKKCNRIGTAEVFDLSIAGNNDVKHRMMAADPKSSWFQEVTLDKRRKIWALSPHSFFVDSYVTLFETNDYPWKAMKYHRRLERWVWIAAILSLLSGLKVPQVCRQLKSTASGKTSAASHRVGGYIPKIRAYVDGLKVEASEAAAYNEFKELIADCMRRVAATLSSAKHDTLTHADLQNCSLEPCETILV